MDPREQRLNTEIEQTRRSLASELHELKLELGELQRQLVIVAGIVAGVVILLKVVRALRRRRPTAP